MAMKRGPRDGRSSDMTLAWLTKNGAVEWEQWRSWMAGWMSTQEGSAGVKLNALVWFGSYYLPKLTNGADPSAFFSLGAREALPDITALLEESMSSGTAAKNQNWITDFIDWVIKVHLCEPDDNGRDTALVKNPFVKRKEKIVLTETVHNPLPYTYIQELRGILCPEPRGHFGEWTWAQSQSGQVRSDFGDWFEVDPDTVDQNDPDCVWRTRVAERMDDGKKRSVTIHEMWSPVRTMVLLMKLHLPLRTYQVRFLDSGESDTWRYEGGQWVINTKHDFSLGKESNPWGRGIFRRLISQDTASVMTGLYVSTNKTADQNKDALERGYTIPWQNEDVLYWLEKLRNWQEKYNPIQSPMPCSQLEEKHFASVKTVDQKRDMGSMCFLFRDPTATGVDRAKPIPNYSIPNLWYRLLTTLEDNVAMRGQTLSNGARLRFVDPTVMSNGQPTKTEFPLHSLRVSLLTCYAMDGRVPMAVLSKLIAGHARILMTLYYTRPTPAMVSRAMDGAIDRIDAQQQDSLRVFLLDADLRQISAKTAYRDEGSIELALASRNAVGWEYRHIGLCLVGGNHVRSDEMSTTGGCWNGGELISKAKGIVYGPVPHGDENCVRCRWLVTDASYLPSLVAHLNMLSYKASLAASLAVEHEQEKDELLDIRYFAVEKGEPFTQQAELQQAERRYEKQVGEADEYAKDLVACFQLISRLVAIEEGRYDEDDNLKLVAVGTLEDIHQPISFIETNSEIWQLAQICENAEIYADLSDELRKTPAIEKRSQALNRMLMKQGYSPVFMNMDERLQLIAGNAMMRSMATQAAPRDQLEGFRQVAGLIEAGQSLHLLPTGIEALEQVIKRPLVKLADLITSSSKQVRDLIHD